MKKIISIIIFLMFIILSYAGFYYFKPIKTIELLEYDEINIDNKLLSITYYDSNYIKESIAFGNIYSKIIKLENNNEIDLAYAINIKNVSISDDTLTYNLSLSKDKINYTLIDENKSITNDSTLGYNFVIDANNVIYIKIDFKGNHELEPTNFEGNIYISNNMSEKESFYNDILTIQSKINKDINDKNGINKTGIYYYDIEGILNNYKGYVLIDALDISDLEFIYTVYNDKLMLYNYKLIKPIPNNKILNASDEVKTQTLANICSNYTKKECINFNELEYTENGGENNFLKDVMKVYNLVLNDFDKTRKQVVIYDIQNDILNDTNLKGYILINNLEREEYYLYLTNEIFMISGYNITKLGDIKIDSNTIRTYNISAFNLSSNSKLSVCSFSKFTECFDKSGNIIN